MSLQLKDGATLYFFKRASDNKTILGENIASVYNGQLWIRPTSGDNIILCNADGSEFLKETDVKTLKKESGNFYTDIDDFNAVSGSFFFSVGDAVVTSTGLMFTDSETGLKGRAVFKNGQWFFDKELTSTGFEGTESTDGGATGDWMTSGGF